MDRPPTPPKWYHLVQRFDALALGSSKKPTKKPTEKELPNIPQHAREPDEQSRFIGGFSPELLAMNATRNSQPRTPAAETAAPTGVTTSPPVPPQNQIPVHMPIPMPALKQSLTMQYALKSIMSHTPTEVALANPTVAAPPRPPSTPAWLPQTAPAPSLSVPGRLPAVTPSRPRAASVPLSPATSTASTPGRVQCSGMTKARTRCSRPVKLPEMYAELDPTPALYCHQHKERTLAQRGVFVPDRSPEKYIEFSHYIPEYLQVDTQLALKKEMSKAISSADRPGYIYAFQIIDDDRPDVIQLKVGRAVNLVQRLDQWEKQCGSKDQVPRGCWPGIVEGGDGTGGSLLKGNFIPGERGPFCHRVERLVHLELIDLSLHAPYLNPGWPNHTSPSSARSPKKKVTICPDCDTIHKEIFAFPRPKEGRYKGREWELIVKPVIEKWGKFVEEHYVSPSVNE